MWLAKKGEKTVPHIFYMKNQKKMTELLNELREALSNWGDDQKRMEFCRISASTLTADAENTSVPWDVITLHYYALAQRACRVRAAGRFPDGSPAGSPNPSATTPPLSQILARRCPGD